MGDDGGWSVKVRQSSRARPSSHAGSKAVSAYPALPRTPHFLAGLVAKLTCIIWPASWTALLMVTFRREGGQSGERLTWIDALWRER